MRIAGFRVGKVYAARGISKPDGRHDKTGLPNRGLAATEGHQRPAHYNALASHFVGAERLIRTSKRI